MNGELKKRFLDSKMFRNCFEEFFIRLVVLIVLGDRCQRVKSDGNYDVSKPSSQEHQKPIYDRSSNPDVKLGVHPGGDFGGSETEAIDARYSRERNSRHGRNDGLTSKAGTDPNPDQTQEERLAPYAARFFVSPRKTRIKTVPVRKKRQMVEYYVDSPKGIIESYQSHKGQYRVALGRKSSKEKEQEEEERDEEREEERDVEETGRKRNAYQPEIVTDDSGVEEDVFFSDAKSGQNRDALNLFLARSERSAETDSQLAGRIRRRRNVISSINDVPGIEEAWLLPVDYKDSIRAEERSAEQADFPRSAEHLSDFGNSSTNNAKTILLQQIVESILKNDTVASLISKASRRSERGKRQILDYFVDIMTGKIDKRDTSKVARQDSTRNRTGRRLISTAEDLGRNAYESKKRKQRNVNRRNIGAEIGRSIVDDTDDLEYSLGLPNFAQRGEGTSDLNAYEQRRGSDDANDNVRRHSYVLSDDAKKADDDARSFGKRRALYDDPPPNDDVQEEDFYYVQEENNLAKRETGQKNEDLDHEFKDSVGAGDVQKSQRDLPPSQEERQLLSKELVEIMIKEINDRVHGKPGDPELQVRTPPPPSSIDKQREMEKMENPEMPKQSNSASAENKNKSNLRNKRRAHHRKPTNTIKRRSSKVKDDFDKLAAERQLTEERLRQSRMPTSGEDADERADDLDMTKQIVAIVIEHAVRQLRNLANSSDSSVKQGLNRTGQQSSLETRGLDAAGAPPPLLIPIQTPPVTTPFIFWDVEPIPKTNMEKGLMNSSDEYFMDGLHFHQVTYPSKPTNNNGSQARRRKRRQKLTDEGKSVQSSTEDFSSAAAKTHAGQRVFGAVETAIFCRIIRRLVDQGKLPSESYEGLLSNRTCFKYAAPYTNRRRRRFAFRIPTPGPCVVTDEGHLECSEMKFPEVDVLAGHVADWRCEDLIYMAIHPSVFNVYRGEVTTRIPLSVVYDSGGYTWGGIGTGIKPPAAPPKRNSEWGVLFAFTSPFRLWGLRFVETPATFDSVRSIAVYLQRSDDKQNRWTPVTEAGSTEPRIISESNALINFTEIYSVTGILIFPQEWQGNPVLPHAVFISCSAESSLETDDPLHLPITRTSSWESILDGIARSRKSHGLHGGHNGS